MPMNHPVSSSPTADPLWLAPDFLRFEDLNASVPGR